MTVFRKRSVTPCVERDFARGAVILSMTRRTRTWNGDLHKELPGVTQNSTYRSPACCNKRKSSQQPRIPRTKGFIRPTRRRHQVRQGLCIRPVFLRRELYLRHTGHTTRDWGLSSEAARRTAGKACDVGTHKRMPRLLPTPARQARRSRGGVGRRFPRSAGRPINERKHEVR